MHYTSHSYGEVRAQCLHPLAHLGFHVSSEETAVGVVWLVISGGMLGEEDYHVFLSKPRLHWHPLGVPLLWNSTMHWLLLHGLETLQAAISGTLFCGWDIVCFVSLMLRSVSRWSDKHISSLVMCDQTTLFMMMLPSMQFVLSAVPLAVMLGRMPWPFTTQPDLCAWQIFWDH